MTAHHHLAVVAYNPENGELVNRASGNIKVGMCDNALALSVPSIIRTLIQCSHDCDGTDNILVPIKLSMIILIHSRLEIFTLAKARR